MLLHYLVNLKTQKFAILMHVKHVSRIKEMPNAVKIKINTMQNINNLRFVPSLSLTVGLSTIKHQHSKKLTRRIEAT